MATSKAIPARLHCFRAQLGPERDDGDRRARTCVERVVRRSACHVQRDRGQDLHRVLLVAVIDQQKLVAVAYLRHVLRFHASQDVCRAPSAPPIPSSGTPWPLQREWNSHAWKKWSF